MDVVPIIHIIIAVLLIVAILMQQSEGGLGAMFGGDDGGMRRTRRGAERFLFNATIVLAVLFAATAVAALIL